MLVNSKKVLLSMAMGIILLSSAMASDASDAYKKIMQLYQSAKTVNLQFDMKLISDVEPEETIKGCRIIKSGDQYYSSIDGNELVFSKPYALQSSQEEKLLYLTNYVPMGDNPLEMPFYQELLENPENFTLSNLGGSLSKLTINTNNFDVYRVEIVFDRQTFFIQKYTTFLQEFSPFEDDKVLKSAIVCTYTKHELLDKQQTFSEFDWSKFIVVSKGKISPAASFGGFQFINDYKTQGE